MAMLKTGIDKAHLVWAILCIIGFGAFQWYKPEEFVAMVHYIWIPLTIIGIGAMYYWVPKHKLSFFWAILSIAGMIVSMGMWLEFFPLMQFGINYGVLWAIIMGIGFLYTGYVMKIRYANYVAGVACLLIALLIFFKVPPLFDLGWAFVPLGLAAGLPMAYDSWFS